MGKHDFPLNKFLIQTKNSQVESYVWVMSLLYGVDGNGGIDFYWIN